MKLIKERSNQGLKCIKQFICDKRHLAMVIAFGVSIAYIAVLDAYDRTPSQVASLYEAVSVNGIAYEQVEVDVKGLSENEEIPLGEVIARQNQCNKALSHTKECSRFCAIEHPVSGEVEVFSKEGYINATAGGTQEMSTYTLTIKNEERNQDTTVYNMKIQGLQDIGTIDFMRNKSIDLFKEWDTNPSETISFVGYIDGQINTAQKENYKTQILKSLNGRFVDYYQDDYNPTTEAYYGYTPLVREYTTTSKGAKTNTQITFTYDELQNKTQVIIAFPFYNNPY